MLESSRMPGKLPQVARRPRGWGSVPRQLRQALLATSVLASTFVALNFAAADGDYLISAQKYLDEGEPAAALIEVKNALQASPNDAQARVLLAKIYLRMGDPVNAESALLRARELGASGDDLDLMLAYARLSKGAFQDVLTQTENQTGTVSGTQRDLVSARGDALLALEKFDEAEEAYDRVLASGPHAMALRGKAVIALMRKQPEESRKLLDQALELDPKNDEIVTADAEWYLRQGKPEQARERFADAIELNPLKLIPRLGHIRASLSAGDTQAAVKEAEELKKLQPNSILVLFQDSVVQLAAGNYEAAKNSADRILAADRYHAGAMNVSGSSAYALGLYEQAAARLTNYLQVVPQDNQARMILAASLLRLKDAPTAKAVLRPLMTSEPQDPRALALMGTAEALSGNNDAAVKYLDKASALSPEDQTLRSQLGMVRIAAGDSAKGVADLQQVIDLSPASGSGVDSREITLIVGLLKTGDFGAALENVQRLQKDHPDDARLFVLEGVAHMGADEKEPAQAAFSRAIELDPRTVDARLNLAQLRTREGEFDSAKKLLEEVVARRPDHYLAMLQLAALAGRAGDVNQQANWLERAAAAQPNLPALRLQLALFYLGHQRAQKALETAQLALQQKPDSIEFLGIVGQAQLQTGKTDEAVLTFERLVKVPPESAEAHFLLARAYGLAGKHDQMQAELNRALELDPSHLPSQVALVRFLVLDGKGEEAGKRMQALKAAHPENLDVLAQEGWLQLHEGRADEAVKTLQAVVDRSESGPSRDVVESLAQAHWQARQWDASVAVRKGWLENNPKDIPMLLALGQAYTQLGRLDDAAKAYRDVQAVMPDNVLALNNLAWLLQKTAPDEALGYAERANKLAPGTPSIMDTLGWLVLERGDAARAVGLFEEASQKAPDNPQYRYHLAQALHRTGEKDRAKQILEELLADKRLENEHAKIRATLQQFGN
jgi:putative PEP-CTERM system TPR-repeat lipoprotein